MLTAVIYSRVSTNLQNDLSQIEDLKKWAKINHFKVTKTFGESVSGYDSQVERIEFEKMKEYVVDNDIKHILIWELSRLGRSTFRTLKEIEFFKEKGINIFFKKENLNTLSNSPTDNLLLNLLSSIAELERNTIVERSHRGKVSAAEKGKRIGFAIMPYGFDADEHGYIIIKEEEAKVVRGIYEMAVKGVSLKGIANNLNSLNILTRNTLRGKKRILRNGNEVDILWRSNTVRKILRSTLYKGDRTFKKEILIKIPSIVDANLWDKVQDRFLKHIGYLNNTKYEYLFKGKIFCGSCGLAFLTRTETRYQNKPSYYFCSGRRDSGIKCKSGQFKSEIFDNKIYDLLFRHSDVMLKVYNETVALYDNESKKKQIVFYRNEIIRQEGTKKRIINLYKDKYIDENEFKSDIATIRNSIIDSENNISRIEREISTFSGPGLADTLTSLLHETDFKTKFDFVQKWVDKLIIYRVENTGIDFTKLSYTEMKTMKQSFFRQPHGNDKLIYVEVFAFGNSKPLKVVLSNVTEICYLSNKLTYFEEIGYLTDK